MSTLSFNVQQLVSMSCAAGKKIIPSLKEVVQSFPEAMHADAVIEFDVRDLDGDDLVKLTNFLVNNGLAVQRLSLMSNSTTLLRVWSASPSICSIQRDIVMAQFVSFQFTDGYQWQSKEDLRGTLYSLPRRIDTTTWMFGAYFGLEDGGPHGIWNLGTFVVKFSQSNPLEVEAVNLYHVNGTTVYHQVSGARLAEITSDIPDYLL